MFNVPLVSPVPLYQTAVGSPLLEVLTWTPSITNGSGSGHDGCRYTANVSLFFNQTLVKIYLLLRYIPEEVRVAMIVALETMQPGQGGVEGGGGGGGGGGRTVGARKLEFVTWNHILLKESAEMVLKCQLLDDV